MKDLGNKVHAFGKALMMPISVIAAAGIFLGLAAAMQNPAVTGDAFADMQIPQLIIGFIRQIAGALFANLPLFFAVASAIGLANAEKPTAAFAAVIGFISMHVGVKATLTAQNLTPVTTSIDALTAAGMDHTAALMYAAEFTQTLGIFTYNMSVLGGVIAGVITVLLHNRFYTIELPTAISFFGGRRFVPIITVVCLPLVGIGLATIDNQTVVGALNIFNASLTHPGMVSDETIRGATTFLAQGKIPIMMFGLPGAALAMYHCARPQHKKRVKALVLAGALASFTTGITEPLEFCFIFVSPLLYLIHAALSGLSFMLMSMLHLMIGNIQGGAIDLVVFGILGGLETRWWYAVLLGLIYFLAYYFAFRFIIRRMNVETPGRESEEHAPETQPISADQRTKDIITGLGGENNITDVDCCFTRLRVQVKDMTLVVDKTLMSTGANGINRVNEHNIQVIYGPKVEKIASDVKIALGVTG
ncbi:MULTISPECIES: PTS transporter subunit EIIC [unclassified Brenneria]|uniref:PTS transporter subunit EIIC n=1 Tax=unclassified Brenneria TaxID=2634434 RepID=UPI00155640BC|nr:PTS transporter subunit EIIC [Brenneria sp. hezel4-2-4]MEE3650411.1 PTS transporter subunit EIIC [Brenneria sp. HEZEL_4_2_4]NPD00367.1 PTS transporter subunit EIIC [Brenneria sp. hezel4-2-4]